MSDPDVNAGEPLTEIPMEGDKPDFTKNHGCCRDFYCLIVFIVAIIAMIVIFAMGFTEGHPIDFIDPTNSYGYFCGRKSESLNKDYSTKVIERNKDRIYHPDGDSSSWDFSDQPVVVRLTWNKTKDGFNYKCHETHDFYYANGDDVAAAKCANYIDVCIHECPEEPACINAKTGQILDYSECKDLAEGAFPSNNIFPVTYGTTNIAWRCLPLDKYTDHLPEAIEDLIGSAGNFVAQIIADFKKAWWVLLLAGALSLVLSFLSMCCFQLCGFCIVWLVIFASLIIILIVGILVLVYGFQKYNDPYQTNVTSAYVFIGFGAALILLDLLLLLIVIALRKRISLATRLIQESSRAIRSMCFIVCAPVLYIIFWIIAVVLILIAVVFYFSADVTLDDYGSRSITTTKGSYVVLVFVLLFFFWVTFFIIGLNQSTIAGAGATWYFVHDKSDVPSFPIFRSLKVLFGHHLGSVAVGSFLIALVATFRTIVLYLQKKYAKSENTALKAALCCLSCCLKCCQRLVEFISSRAYIMMMIYGNSFFTSAIAAMNLMLRNIIRTAILSGLTTIIIFLTILTVSVIATTVCVIIFRPDFLFASVTTVLVTEWWFFSLLCAIIAFAVALLTMQVYNSLIDTIFLCFLVDEEVASSHAVPNYAPYASESLRQYMDDVAQRATAEAQQATEGNKE